MSAGTILSPTERNEIASRLGAAIEQHLDIGEYGGPFGAIQVHRDLVSILGRRGAFVIRCVDEDQAEVTEVDKSNRPVGGEGRPTSMANALRSALQWCGALSSVSTSSPDMPG